MENFVQHGKSRILLSPDYSNIPEMRKFYLERKGIESLCSEINLIESPRFIFLIHFSEKFSELLQ